MSMEDNHNSSPKSVKVCEKILSAVTSSPVYRTLRRISFRQEHPSAASPAPNPSQLIDTPFTVARTFDIPITTPASHEHPNSSKGSQQLDAVEVPIEFDFSSPPKLNVEGKALTPFLPVESKNPRLVSPAKQVHKEAKQPGAEDDEDPFSKFISISKMKMLNGVDDDAQDKKKRKERYRSGIHRSYKDEDQSNYAKYEKWKVVGEFNINRGAEPRLQLQAGIWRIILGVGFSPSNKAFLVACPS